MTNNGWVEIVDGLQGDERVVVVGQAGLKTGTAVKIVESATAGAASTKASAG